VAVWAVPQRTSEPSISGRSAHRNAPIPFGATRPYQVDYRDGAAAFYPDPPWSRFNVSNGFLVAWGGGVRAPARFVDLW